jgi:gas vesicle protein
MSQQDNFVSGFFTGAVVGGVVGSILGVLVTSRLANVEASVEEESFLKLKGNTIKNSKRQLKAPTEQSIERARQGLEDKIAQLNEAIDDVRQQLGGVNSHSKANDEVQAIIRDS